MGNQYYNNLMFINKTQLIHEYVDLESSSKELSEKYDTDRCTMTDLLKSLGVKIRNSTEANNTNRSRTKNSNARAKFYSDPTNRKIKSNEMLEAMNRPEVRSKLSLAMVKRWSDPIQRANLVRGWIISSHIRPSGLEQVMIDIVLDYNLPFKYNGDNGDVLVEKLTPDFVHNNLKMVILVDGEIYHKDFTREYNIDKTYKRNGYKVLHFSGAELTYMDEVTIYMIIWDFTKRLANIYPN